MTDFGLTLRLSVPAGLLEGPRYHPEWGLVYADAVNGGVQSLGLDGKLRQLVPHRRGIGGLVLHAKGGAVITGRNVAYKAFLVDPEERPRTQVLIERDPDANRVGFNDLTTDAEGRVYVGSLGFVAMHDAIDGRAAGPPGSLLVIDLDGAVSSLADDIQLSNGMAFSADGAILYQCDSGRREVLEYELDFSSGSPRVASRSVFAQLEDGVPDGIAVDADGTVWVALAHAGSIVGLDTRGRVRDRIPVPLPMVTSMCFGGEDMKTMYIVTGSHGSPPGVGAGVFECRMPAPGVPVALARTPVAETASDVGSN